METISKHLHVYFIIHNSFNMLWLINIYVRNLIIVSKKMYFRHGLQLNTTGIFS